MQLTEAEVERLVLLLRRFLERNLRGILEGLQSDELTAKEAAKALGGLETAIKEAGLARYFERVRKLFQSEYDAVQGAFEETTGKKALLGGFVRSNLKAVVDDRLAMAGKMVESYLGDVRTAVMDTVIAGKTVKPTDVLESATGATFRNLQTELNTSLMAYQRAVHAEKAKKAGITQFLYVGPDDKVTREFCHEHVDRVYTAKEIAAMDNGQGLPVEIYGGGYNCRHHWRPISDELADELRAGEGA